ncbi:hypothetical protein FRC08_008620 [Ceratobasidium sp. 394]|nr:hypothetical protein FRC08_008620 [Ceratobasidium sp. 394]
MPQNDRQYNELFNFVSPQFGRLTVFTVSPKGSWICLATDKGDLTFLNRSNGLVSLQVGMGPLSCITAATWVGDHEIIFGCVNGAVYMATIETDPRPAERKIRIVELIHRFVSPICAIAYNAKNRFLALGYSNYVAIWRHRPGERNAAWEAFDFFRVRYESVPAHVNSLHFLGANNRLFIGSESGAATWSSARNLVSLDTQEEGYRIVTSAISSDGSIMAVSTLDRFIHIWPLSPQGPHTALSHKYLLKSGQEGCKFQHYTPVTLTKDYKVVCGTPDGTISILDRNGVCRQKLTRRAHCVEAIVANQDMLYVAFTGAIGVITIVVYSNSDTKQAEVKGAFALPELRPTYYTFGEVYKRHPSRLMLHHLVRAFIAY